MYEQDILKLENYIRENLYCPRIEWGKKEFELQSYSRWAAFEILELLIKESLKLPEYLRDYPDTPSSFEIVKDFKYEMEYRYHDSMNGHSRLIFLIACDQASEILDLFEGE